MYEAFWSALWSALWLFLGIIAGAAIQYRLNKRVLEDQRTMARRILRTEIELNLSELNNFYQRVSFLRERISASQIDEQNIFISFELFDYSAMSPLVQSGHFHTILTQEQIRDYFAFVRFFSNANASIITSELKAEHGRRKSLDYLAFLEEQAQSLEERLLSVQEGVRERMRRKTETRLFRRIFRSRA